MDSFEEIYSANYHLIFNLVRRMIPDHDDATDIVQDVFVQLYQCIERGKSINYPKSWLYKVTINRCIDFIKQRPKQEKINTEVFNLAEDPATEKNEKQIVVELALSQLETRERVLAILYSEGFSYKEIAEITGIRNTSVGKTLSRILTKLGDELKKLQYELY